MYALVTREGDCVQIIFDDCEEPDVMMYSIMSQSKNIEHKMADYKKSITEVLLLGGVFIQNNPKNGWDIKNVKFTN